MADVVHLVRQHAERSPVGRRHSRPGTRTAHLRRLAPPDRGRRRDPELARRRPRRPRRDGASRRPGAGRGARRDWRRGHVRAPQSRLSRQRIRVRARGYPRRGTRGAGRKRLHPPSTWPGAAASRCWSCRRRRERKPGLFALAGAARRPPARPGFAESGRSLLVLHTSGTAARPKLVPLTHRNVVASARDIAAVLELTARDRCLNVMPLFHIHGQSTVWSSLAAGASVVCTPGFAAAEFLDWLEEFRTDLVHGGPLDPPNGPGGGPAAPRSRRAARRCGSFARPPPPCRGSSSRTWSAPSACRSSKRTG